MPQDYIAYQSKSDNIRFIVVVNGKAYYQSTGKSSSYPNIWFPFLGVVGTKPLSIKNLPRRVYQHEVLAKLVTASQGNSGYIIKFENDILQFKPNTGSLRRPPYEGRIPTKDTLISSYRLTGSELHKRYGCGLLEHSLTRQEREDAATPIEFSEKASLLTSDPDKVNEWLVAQGAEEATWLLRPVADFLPGVPLTAQEIREKINVAIVGKNVITDPTLEKPADGVDCYLGWMEQHAQGTRGFSRISHWYHGDSGKRRARELLIVANAEPIDISNIITKLKRVMAESSIRKHSLNRYLMAHFINEDFGINPQNATLWKDREFSNLMAR